MALCSSDRPLLLYIVTSLETFDLRAPRDETREDL